MSPRSSPAIPETASRPSGIGLGLSSWKLGKRGWAPRRWRQERGPGVLRGRVRPAPSMEGRRLRGGGGEGPRLSHSWEGTLCGTPHLKESGTFRSVLPWLPCPLENVGLLTWREAAGRPGRAWAQRSEVRGCLRHPGNAPSSGGNWLEKPVSPLARLVKKAGHGEGRGGQVGRRQGEPRGVGAGPPPSDPHVEPLWGQVAAVLSPRARRGPRSPCAPGRRPRGPSDGAHNGALSLRPGARAAAHPAPVSASPAAPGRPSAPFRRRGFSQAVGICIAGPPPPPQTLALIVPRGSRRRRAHGPGRGAARGPCCGGRAGQRRGVQSWEAAGEREISG